VQLRRRANDFRQIGARVVLVGLGTPEDAAAFKDRFAIPFPLFVDPDKALFKAFHLKQASATSFLSPGMAVKGMSAMFRGYGIGMPTGDVRQLPGVFIIDAEGVVRYRYLAEGPADHPDPDVLLEEIQAVLGRG
jgi:peroxiredoxin